MKKIILLTCLTLAAFAQCYSQAVKADHIFTYQTFDAEILNFIPVKRENVTEKDFNYALHILNETKSSKAGNSDKLNVADFWNITSAFIGLKEPAINIEIAFKKAIALDASTVCSYVQMLGAAKLEKAIPETFQPFYANCLKNTNVKNEKFNAKQYADDNKLDAKLVLLMDTINSNDQRYRKITPLDAVKQHPLDLKARHSIDSLHAIYKTYIGRSLVGEKYEAVMWSVIQHSPDNATDTKMMEKYLPDVSKAVDTKELPITPLKMLIDRIYTIKYQYQIFGSQSGNSGSVPMAKDEVILAVKKKYHIQ
ncbi:hypothetical protein [Mucilaginibacter polytrichastri]|uniref:Lipoprotein n=1 Tax=Mucilaginibacter polytrichastri TaxID=1302689 RepID=A0A1Q5ZVV2_9SPHI|nr:hypothetical protein [Mucilaginibacter polytrichastri]OKS85889.1 hypothetical protein RG47T_1335 [Mucilaginibacter polytrichastri]SFS60794.1 hypothetical protein SAMN04487890_102245 [Mucilaginibacter polytrichastri]